MADDPDVGLLTNLGIAVALIVAVVVMVSTRQKR